MDDVGQRQLRALAFLDYTEGHQNVQLSETKLTQVADLLIEMGKLLKKDPREFLANNVVLPNKAEIDSLVRVWEQAIEKMPQLRQKALSLGMRTPF